MSQEQAKAFIQQVNGNETLQQRIVALNGDIPGLLKIAAELGYTFTEDDWSGVMRALATGELSLSDLEHVVGGATLTTPAAPSPIPIPYPNWWPK